MGPNSLTNTSQPGGMAATTMNAGEPAVTAAPAQTARLKIHYGDAIKAERLMAGLRNLQAAQAHTQSFIRTINPELSAL